LNKNETTFAQVIARIVAAPASLTRLRQDLGTNMESLPLFDLPGRQRVTLGFGDSNGDYIAHAGCAVIYVHGVQIL